MAFNQEPKHCNVSDWASDTYVIFYIYFLLKDSFFLRIPWKQCTDKGLTEEEGILFKTEKKNGKQYIGQLVICVICFIFIFLVLCMNVSFIVYGNELLQKVSS